MIIGCFCCIGGCQEALKITANQVQQNISKGRSCQDTIGDVIDGNPTGRFYYQLFLIDLI